MSRRRTKIPFCILFFARVYHRPRQGLFLPWKKELRKGGAGTDKRGSGLSLRRRFRLAAALGVWEHLAALSGRVLPEEGLLR